MKSVKEERFIRAGAVDTHAALPLAAVRIIALAGIQNRAHG